MAEEPWGKDAEMTSFVYSYPVKEEPCNSAPLTQIGDLCIRFHQDVISPADGPRSHFIPSSSQYTRDAMQKYGFFQGFCMGCDRLMRENSDPWIYPTVMRGKNERLKCDPVK